ncbi:hypothetical protein [Natronospira bacteriovora]|uniref:Uncharacterized protein n=1 Tax=Natronospira bacteriovora TaxID=3069753 RepID=A0ABU0W5I4_9GAMM|nr:hypothetical protein [Natronospira sp. AB-CW4]MDQ2069277.1 hypothetical protein [Natronospira sp. AB-CW4]
MSTRTPGHNERPSDIGKPARSPAPPDRRGQDILDAALEAAGMPPDTDPQELLDWIEEQRDEPYVEDPIYTTKKGKPCNWREDWEAIWTTDCGLTWGFPDGGPEESRVRYCPQCGSTVHINHYQEDEGEAA